MSASSDSAPRTVLSAAVAAARRSLGRSSPRPPSCALLHGNGAVRATASSTRAAGALSTLDARLKAEGGAGQEGDLYLLFEPEPAEVMEAGWLSGRRVWIGFLDPALHGAGLRALEAVGAAPIVGVGVGGDADRLVEPYLRAALLARPHVLLKSATSLDGRTATRSGHSQWITNEAARARGRRMRAEVDAIVVGVQTALADDPALTSRLEGAPDPLRVVLDSRARLPPDSTLARTASDTPTLLATTDRAEVSARERLLAQGVQVEVLPKDAGDRVSVHALLARLYGLGLRSVLIEGGATVAGAFLDAGTVDRVAWFLAPMLIGGERARCAVGGEGAHRLHQALHLDDLEVSRVGSDLLVEARVQAPGARHPLEVGSGPSAP